MTNFSSQTYRHPNNEDFEYDVSRKEDTETVTLNFEVKARKTKTPNNFEKVKNFMAIMGQDCPQIPVEPKNAQSITKLRVSLIEEELGELKEAVEKNDFVEVVDALADILYVTYGAGVAWGVDLQKAFELVHESNMSKICNSREEAEETVKWYKNNPEKGYPSPRLRKALDDVKDTKYVVYEESTGKILKNVNYRAVDLSKLVLPPSPRRES